MIKYNKSKIRTNSILHKTERPLEESLSFMIFSYFEQRKHSIIIEMIFFWITSLFNEMIYTMEVKFNVLLFANTNISHENLTDIILYKNLQQNSTDKINLCLYHMFLTSPTDFIVFVFLFFFYVFCFILVTHFVACQALVVYEKLTYRLLYFK